MSSLVKWLETYVLPPASRLAQLRWLVAMRDTFISLLPITMAGSIAMLFNSIIRAAKVQMHWDTFYSLIQPKIIAVNSPIVENCLISKAFLISTTSPSMCNLTESLMLIAKATKEATEPANRFTS